MSDQLPPELIQALDTLITHCIPQMDKEQGVEITFGDTDQAYRVQISLAEPPEGTLCPSCSISGLDVACDLCDGTGQLPDIDDDDETP